MKICPKGNRSLKLDSFTLPSFLFLIEMHIPSIPQFFPGQRLGFRDKVYRSWPAILSLSSINENVKRLNELFNPPACIFLKRPSPDLLQLRTIAKVSSNHERSSLVSLRDIEPVSRSTTLLYSPLLIQQRILDLQCCSGNGS